MLYDNPAGRLQLILDQGRQKSSEESCRKTWEEVLQVKPGDSDDLYAKLGQVMSLPRQIIQLLRTNFPSQLQGSEFWRSQIDNAFTNQNLSGKWGTFISHISPQSIAQIGVTAELIQATIATKLVPDQDLDRLASDIQSLITDIETSDLTVHLKNYLARELTELLQAIRDYRVSGATPALKQAEAMVAHTLIDPEYKNFLTSNELGKRLLDNLNATAAVLTIALQLPQLGVAFSALLK